MFVLPMNQTGNSRGRTTHASFFRLGKPSAILASLVLCVRVCVRGRERERERDQRNLQSRSGCSVQCLRVVCSTQGPLVSCGTILPDVTRVAPCVGQTRPCTTTIGYHRARIRVLVCFTVGVCDARCVRPLNLGHVKRGPSAARLCRGVCGVVVQGIGRRVPVQVNEHCISVRVTGRGVHTPCLSLTSTSVC